MEGEELWIWAEDDEETGVRGEGDEPGRSKRFENEEERARADGVEAADWVAAIRAGAGEETIEGEEFP